MTGPQGAMSQQAGERQMQQIIANLPPVSGLLALLPPQLRKNRINQFYIYNADFLPLLASATDTKNIAVQSDADFVICFAMGVVTDTTDATVVPFVPQLVQLRDTAAGNFLSQSPVHYNMVYGDASNPGIFSVPYFLRAGSTLQVQHQNLVATNRNVRLAFCGFRSVPVRNANG